MFNSPHKLFSFSNGTVESVSQVTAIREGTWCAGSSWGSGCSLICPRGLSYSILAWYLCTPGRSVKNDWFKIDKKEKIALLGKYPEDSNECQGEAQPIWMSSGSSSPNTAKLLYLQCSRACSTGMPGGRCIPSLQKIRWQLMRVSALLFSVDALATHTLVNTADEPFIHCFRLGFHDSRQLRTTLEPPGQSLLITTITWTSFPLQTLS